MSYDPAQKRVLAITDNPLIANAMMALRDSAGVKNALDIGRSPVTHPALLSDTRIQEIDVQSQCSQIVQRYGRVISAHCKQIFPCELHENTECVNIHPGVNPWTRGWFPQVWSIMLDLPLGFTIHRIDGALDHGEIIHQEIIPIHEWDTSHSAYTRVIKAEIDWIEKNFGLLTSEVLSSLPMVGEGRLFRKRDFAELLELKLDEQATFREVLRRLRALSFPGYQNAWFRDPTTGRRVFVTVSLEVENGSTT